MRQEFIDFCKEYALEHIDYAVGETHYVCDYCHIITDDINHNPAYELEINDNVEALKWLADWIIPAAKYWEYEEMNFGEHLHNPFNNPEAVLACMIIEGVSGILQRCETISETWNDEVEFTQEFVDKVKEEIAALPDGIGVF